MRSREHYEAMRLARKLGLGPDRSRYAEREGIEGTIARAVKSCGVRRARYVGLAKVHLQHLLGAAALNFLRVGEWLAGQQRGARRSPFSKLMTSQATARSRRIRQHLQRTAPLPSVLSTKHPASGLRVAARSCPPAG